jgi:hypothetical protein
MSSLRAGTALRSELARSGLLNSRQGKFFRKIGDRYGLFTWGRRSFGEELADLETGLQADRICTGEQKVQREDLKSESRI